MVARIGKECYQDGEYHESDFEGVFVFHSWILWVKNHPPDVGKMVEILVFVSIKKALRGVGLQVESACVISDMSVIFPPVFHLEEDKLFDLLLTDSPQ